MNVCVKRLLLLSFLTTSLCNTSVHGNIFLDAAHDQIDKISPKLVTHKSPLEFKQAVARYIKQTDLHCLQSSQRQADENLSYKKELRYLFQNYGKFSTATLLSRLRSAHQTMVKHEPTVDSDVYKKYEQISSALLLICAQVFFNDARDQILNALQEVDNLIVYWRYQHNHQISYFFSKSPVKWVMGKEQEKEIAYNLSKLERKQRELYTLLGLLTGHVHTFTESGTAYNDCYSWIEQLFVVLSCIKGLSSYNLDGTQFDAIAAELEVKIKRVSTLRDDYLSSVACARKSNHFVRNWIMYTTLVAAAGYTIHFHAQNPTVLPAAFDGVQDSAKYFFVLLIDPFKKIYKRMGAAFSPTVAGEVKKPVVEGQKEVPLEVLFDEIEITGKEIVSNIAEELETSKNTARERLFSKLQEAIVAIKKNRTELNFYSSSYKFNEEQFNKVVDQVAVRVSPVRKDGKIINEKEVKEYQKAVVELQTIIADLSKRTSLVSSEGLSTCTKLNVFDILFEVVDDFAEPLKRYTDIIDEKILKLFRQIAVVAVNLGRRGDILATQADDKLQDNELTFMFTALIPLIGTCFSITKMYQWATTRNYSPIRIALADINSLLIESAMQLDDHDYGKLVYLICKLRHKSRLLKNSLSTEFLADVAKLESKRYTAQTKRDIVENMFNKYAFLGRIAA
ncbi:MAG TPA: hypothetical protein VKR54_03965 [Candidatus Babeliales bacterium]|nr:hypothetical protein [Candidatus Babeliales bacterium]